jgi:hypothetical protein
MSKKGFIFVVLILVSFNAFAYENSISLGINGIGLTAAYERKIIDTFSVVPEITFSQIYGVLSSVGFVDLRARWYPFSGSFFADLGIGYGIAGSISIATDGLLISPGIGWNFDIGKKDGFTLNLSVCSDWIFRLSDKTLLINMSNADGIAHPKVFSPILGVKFGIGWTF